MSKPRLCGTIPRLTRMLYLHPHRSCFYVHFHHALRLINHDRTLPRCELNRVGHKTMAFKRSLSRVNVYYVFYVYFSSVFVVYLYCCLFFCHCYSLPPKHLGTFVVRVASLILSPLTTRNSLGFQQVKIEIAWATNRVRAHIMSSSYSIILHN